MEMCQDVVRWDRVKNKHLRLNFFAEISHLFSLTLDAAVNILILIMLILN